MMGWLRRITDRIDGLSLRERALLLLAVLVVLYTAWDQLLMMPLQTAQQTVQQQRDGLQAETRALNAKAQQVIARHQHDPNEPLRRRIDSLQAKLDQRDARLNELTVELIGARQMARVLEQALQQRQGLELVRVESAKAERINLGEDQPGQESQAEGDTAETVTARPIYRHGLVLTFEGTYGETQRYLRALEALPWRFYWDSLEYEVTDYPRASVTLRVHTLSLDESWIGV